MIRDTRPDYPPEYDAPDASDWEGDTLGAIAAEYGIEPAADALRAIYKYGDSGATVSVKLPSGERLTVPDDVPVIRSLGPDEPVAAWVVHGIAWDGSDWEYSEEVALAAEVPGALERFAEALDEHLAWTDAEGTDAE